MITSKRKALYVLASLLAVTALAAGQATQEPGFASERTC